MVSDRKTEKAHAEVDAILIAEKGKGVEHLQHHHYKIIISLVVVFGIFIAVGVVSNVLN